MIFSTVAGISTDTAERYIILSDLGPEGLHVVAQGRTPGDVVAQINEAYGSPWALVKLVDVEVVEVSDQ